ncbi:beta-glucanase [Niveomyces insectorum RCEF 264]|uniref:glucan 1,3-beta-glucosidase n=1 Tax=Niveomyces insectorum RCEF 264 TaxID=1081102 RepID=A0A162KAF6_9HYPO|nr:beta-glucanase [Niveomyces insectorum RCEF 264]
MPAYDEPVHRPRDAESRRHHGRSGSTNNNRHHRRRTRSGSHHRGTATHPLSTDALAQLNGAAVAAAAEPYLRREERSPQDRSREEREDRRRERHERHERHEREEREGRPRHERHERHTSRTRSEERRRRRRKEDEQQRRDRERYRTEEEDDNDENEEIEVVVVEEERRRHGRREREARLPKDRRRQYSAIRRKDYGAVDEAHNSDDDDDDGDGDDDGYTRVAAGGRGDRRHRRRRDRRIPSGAVLEEGRSCGARRHGGGHLRGGFGGLTSDSSSGGAAREKAEQLYYKQRPQPKPKWSKKKRLLVFGGIGAAVVILIIIVAAVVVSKKKGGGGGGGGGGGSGSGGGATGLGSISPDSIPADAPSWLNPFKWASTTDFNLTYTNETVGGLPVMGLNTSWDDSAAANAHTPPLSQPWGSYGTAPARGVNLGGWLSLEPFITPSLFSGYDAGLGIVDEWTLCAHLGPDTCARTLEQHYATFVTEATFAEIAAAGLDHVRIPYSYWAVAVYDGDPYLFRTSWRYLLRGIEWARRHGLRVNLDLHGLPGSQNGWNHSGREGAIGWMNGTDGDQNVQRSLDVHDQLSQFFAQPRYAHVLSHYGLANEPRMTFLSVPGVMAWTQTAAALVRRNGLANDTLIVFGDGFAGLGRWQGQPNTHNLVLDVHQYEIFNNEQLVYTHAHKIEYACSGWTQQTQQSMDTATGYGPTIVAEWSQADTDCAAYLGNVNNGNRWTGTYDVGNASLDALTPMCPLANATCTCGPANASPSTYTAPYKEFLLMFAEAQMHSFEKGWGWWYWTWDTENATQWSYKKGLAAGILPADASKRTFQCDTSTIPAFGELLPEYF